MLNKYNPLPKTLRGFKDLKQVTADKDFSFTSYITYSAVAYADDQPYTILLFNRDSELFEKNRDLALTLYLQEIFSLCARFGEFIGKNQMDYKEGNEERNSPILDFKSFAVEGDKIAFVMKYILSLKDLVEFNNENQKPPGFDIDGMIEDIYASINYANTRFEVSNIDIRPESIYAIPITSENGQQTIEYFLTNWVSGGRTELNKQSGWGEGEMEIVKRFLELKEEDPRKKFVTPESLQGASLKADSNAEIYALGLVSLEILGIQQKSWKYLLTLEEPEMYDVILKKIIGDITKILQEQPLQSSIKPTNTNQIPEFTALVSSALKLEPPERTKEFRRLLSLQQTQRKSKSQNKIGTVVEEEKKIDDANDLMHLIIDYEKRKQDIRELLNETDPLNKTKISLEKKNLHDIDAIILGLDTQWTNLQELHLHKNKIGDKGGAAIGSNTSWKNLKKLALYTNSISDEGASAIGRNTTWVNLEELWLYGNKIGDKGAVAIGSNTIWKNLKKLALQTNNIGDEGASAIGRNTIWVNLEELALSQNKIEDKGAVAIGSNTTWKNLKKFSLMTSNIGDEGASAIGKNDVWKQLIILNLSNNKISDEGASAIGRNTIWVNLEELWLYQNEIGDKGGVEIGSNTTWKNLKKLSLLLNHIGDKGAEAIGKNITWENLELLALNQNTIGNSGAFALGNNTVWKKLEEFYMWNNPMISEEGVASLKSNKLFGAIVNFEKQTWMV